MSEDYRALAAAVRPAMDRWWRRQGWRWYAIYLVAQALHLVFAWLVLRAQSSLVSQSGSVPPGNLLMALSEYGVWLAEFAWSFGLISAALQVDGLVKNLSQSASLPTPSRLLRLRYTLAVEQSFGFLALIALSSAAGLALSWLAWYTSGNSAGVPVIYIALDQLMRGLHPVISDALLVLVYSAVAVGAGRKSLAVWVLPAVNVLDMGLSSAAILSYSTVGFLQKYSVGSATPPANPGWLYQDSVLSWLHLLAWLAGIAWMIAIIRCLIGQRYAAASVLLALIAAFQFLGSSTAQLVGAPWTGDQITGLWHWPNLAVSAARASELNAIFVVVTTGTPTTPATPATFWLVFAPTENTQMSIEPGWVFFLLLAKIAWVVAVYQGTSWFVMRRRI